MLFTELSFKVIDSSCTWHTPDCKVQIYSLLMEIYKKNPALQNISPFEGSGDLDKDKVLRLDQNQSNAKTFHVILWKPILSWSWSRSH